ncbi:hypothetical protein N9251_00635 [Gammaproteobacteria bacterium]|nr:hypothetical protein [Gammaproteobacteria bacterium]
METKELIGQLSDEQISVLKNKYREIYSVTVDGHIAYLKKPGRQTLSYASSVGTSDPLKFNELILNECVVGGSDAVKTDDGLFLSVSAKISDLIEIKEADLVKL